MIQVVLVGSAVAVIVALMIIKLARTPKRRKRWMPDIRRVVS